MPRRNPSPSRRTTVTLSNSPRAFGGVMAAILDTEQRADARSADAYRDLIARLSHQSVVKHFDAYADVAWDAPEMRIDPEDPRWELSDDNPLGRTAWYKGQPQGVRARIGLPGIVANMKTGLAFESV